MEVWDEEGTPHLLQLLTHGILTRAFKPPQIRTEDLDFMRNRNIKISRRTDKKDIKPFVLLGCDHLWNFMRSDTAPIPLPSGLHLLPTKLGYLISGKRQKENPAVLQVSRDSEEFDEWDRNWSMDVAQVLTISTSEQEIIEDEKDQWEKFWSMDAAGTEEFASTEKTARAKMDKIVWDRFNETIERRVDGYYVTLPWKDQHPHLPDNKAIAYRRLVSMWNSLSKDEQLLDKYNSVFKD
ncbi:hypothetical protein RB195_022975 [Necator americanus]